MLTRHDAAEIRTLNADVVRRATDNEGMVDRTLAALGATSPEELLATVNADPAKALAHINALATKIRPFLEEVRQMARTFTSVAGAAALQSTIDDAIAAGVDTASLQEAIAVGAKPADTKLKDSIAAAIKPKRKGKP